MSNLPSAEISPRIVNGVLSWYQGDTFSVQMDISLVDQDGDPIDIKGTDIVKVVFRDAKRKSVKEFTFQEIVHNSITLVFDESTTELFPEGGYTYDVSYTANERTTILNDGKVGVE